LDRDGRRAAVVASPPLPPPFPMPAGTNSARGRFYPRGIDTGRDPEGGATAARRRSRGANQRARVRARRRRRGKPRPRPRATRCARDAPRISVAAPAEYLVRFPSVLSTWGARCLRKDSLRDRVEFGFDISVQKRALFRATWAR
jgi:hypothetical protein